MRHGCSILTATTSRSFIKAELIFIVRASRVSNSGRDSPFRSVLRLSANFTDGHWNCAKGVVSAIARQWPVAGFCPVSCSAKALKADGPRGFAPQKSATSESSQRDHTDVLVWRILRHIDLQRFLRLLERPATCRRNCSRDRKTWTTNPSPQLGRVQARFPQRFARCVSPAHGQSGDPD
jgi:hypothetical protein